MTAAAVIVTSIAILTLAALAMAVVRVLAEAKGLLESMEAWKRQLGPQIEELKGTSRGAAEKLDAVSNRIASQWPGDRMPG